MRQWFILWPYDSLDDNLAKWEVNGQLKAALLSMRSWAEHSRQAEEVAQSEAGMQKLFYVYRQLIDWQGKSLSHITFSESPP